MPSFRFAPCSLLFLLIGPFVVAACDHRGTEPVSPAGAAESRMPTKGSPADFTAGGTETVSAARSCDETPPTHLITIRLGGHRPLTLGQGCVKCAVGERFASLSPRDARATERSALVAQKCAGPAEPAEATCGVFFDEFGQAVTARATAEGITMTGLGIGGCGRDLDTLRVSIDDWRSANRLVAIIEEEAARWDAGGSIAVRVAGISIVTPL